MIIGIKPNETFETMADFRKTYPKSILAHMISKWNLDEKIIAQLDFYKLKDIQAHALNTELNSHDGSVILDGIAYTPIYMQCSRLHIRSRAQYQESFMYWMSFRRTKDAAIVLIQPKRNQEIR